MANQTSLAPFSDPTGESHPTTLERRPTRRKFLQYCVGGGVLATAWDWANHPIVEAAPLHPVREPSALPADLKGCTAWAVILCRFNDLPAVTTPVSAFNDFIVGAGQGGVFDYWKDISYGAIDLTGSKVFGWYTMKYAFFTQGNQSRNAWINEAIRLARENSVDLSPFYGVIAVVNANVDDSASGRNLALGIKADWGQSNWRWCRKCQGLAYGGNSAGACPAKGTHDYSGSGDYTLAMNMPSFPGQNNWRWCQKCQGLAFAGGAAGTCPAGGMHDHSASADYRLAFGAVGFPGQNNWRWCKRCQGLAFAGNPTSVCPVGGLHDHSGSGDYTLVTPHFGYVSHFDASFGAHEMGHCYGLNHARCAGKPDEYCSVWDIMGTGGGAYTPPSSAGSLYVARLEKYAPLGPGICAPNLQRLGWLPAERIKTVTASKSRIGESIKLVALNRPELTGYLMVKVVAPDRVCTVEFRQRTRWDRGLPRDAVIVHELRTGGEPFLFGDYQAGQRWVDFERGISLVIEAIDSSSSSATIMI